MTQVNPRLIHLIKEKQEVLTKLQQIKLDNMIQDFKPYPFQRKFRQAGKEYLDRNLMAANQVGKTRGGAHEVACHLTGIYPEDWDGIVFKYPITCWGLGVSNEQLHDVMQRHLFGNLEKGKDVFIPDETVKPFLSARFINKIERNNQVGGLVKNVYIKHRTGGQSIISLKGYEQGQAKLMGSVVDFAWVDEEPKDQTIIPQVMTRLMNGNRGKGGHFMFTFTPENGMTQRVTQLMKSRESTQFLLNATWDDAPHLTEERKEEILKSFPEYQREMRSKGVPVRGTGLIFQINEKDYMYKRSLFSDGFPGHWPRIIGHDFGWDHPQAWVWMAWDRDADIVYIYKVLRMKNTTPATMAGYMSMNKDQWIPIAWPHDGNNKETEGVAKKDLYLKYGLNMVEERATFEGTKSNSVHAGIMMMTSRFTEGRLKVCEDCVEFFEEMRGYYQDQGKIIKLDDDTIDAGRYGLMMLRYARCPPNPDMQRQKRRQVNKDSWV